jgi:flagellar basal-body rod modification protein FlgD
MLRIPSTTAAGGSSTQSADAINNIDLDVFLKLMITEMQNQDPLNPLDNKDMLAQISQIREVGATDKLTSTLDSVLLGQNITSSTNLIGSEISAISDDNQRVSGKVNRVSIEDGQPKLHLDLGMKGEPSVETGEVEKGTYSYRVVWQGENGKLEGIELKDADAVSTDSASKSIRLSNLPVTKSAKQIYRTNSTGEGDYRLVATLDLSQSTYLDKTADDDRKETRQTMPFDSDPKFRQRNFKVSLQNVSEIVGSS